MKKLAAILVFGLISNLACAEVTPYLHLQGGYHATHIKAEEETLLRDSGAIYGIGVGGKLDGKYRLEINWLGRDPMHDELPTTLGVVKLTYKADMFMLNAYRDFLKEGGTILYLGAGVGLTKWKSSTTLLSYEVNENGREFTGALHAGLIGEMSKNISVDFGVSWYHVFVDEAKLSDIDNFIPHMGFHIYLK
ncbi:outer membrane protein [Candidatus Avelusimicrobium sp.]|uniref:outer membrane protein n=1 Tax=Candidatus Avelusimicrobium sp. TaxID=3048833 RepID=UPI003D7EE62A